MEEKDIKVNYLHGFKRDNFFELENLGFEVDIPEERDQAPIFNMGTRPEDYIIIFTIYFSLKIVDALANGIAEKFIANFSKTVKKIWNKHKDSKPAKIVSGKEPEFKLPKAKLTFKISEEESTTIEITNELSKSELDKILKTQLKLVKMQYKHRKLEQKLKNKGK